MLDVRELIAACNIPDRLANGVEPEIVQQICLGDREGAANGAAHGGAMEELSPADGALPDCCCCRRRWYAHCHAY